MHRERFSRKRLKFHSERSSSTLLAKRRYSPESILLLSAKSLLAAARLSSNMLLSLKYRRTDPIALMSPFHHSAAMNGLETLTSTQHYILIYILHPKLCRVVASPCCLRNDERDKQDTLTYLHGTSRLYHFYKNRTILLFRSPGMAAIAMAAIAMAANHSSAQPSTPLLPTHYGSACMPPVTAPLPQEANESQLPELYVCFSSLPHKRCALPRNCHIQL